MLVLAGKTCSGKDTVKKELVKLGMTPVVTYTTRPMRDGEVDGEAYHFTSREDFMKKVEDGFFCELTYYRVANGDTWFYGSCADDYDDNGVLILNPNGIKDLKFIHELNPVVAYLNAPDDIIWKRLEERGDNPNEAKRRVQTDLIDFRYINKLWDISVMNNGILTPKAVAKKIYDAYEELVNEKI